MKLLFHTHSRVVTMFGLITAMLALGGCGSSPVTRYYTLSSANAASAQPSPASAQAQSLAVAPVTLPESIDRIQLVVRRDANRVDVLDTEHWAQALKREIPRVLSQNLADVLPAWRVAAHPQHAASGADYTLFLDIQRFELIAGEGSLLEAIWTIRRGDELIVNRRRAVIREPAAGNSYEAMVAAHSRALATLSAQIAEPLHKETAAR